MEKKNVGNAYLDMALCLIYDIFNGKSFGGNPNACKDVMLSYIHNMIHSSHFNIEEMIKSDAGIGIGLGKNLKDIPGTLSRIIHFIEEIEIAFNIPKKQRTKVFETLSSRIFIFSPQSRIWYIAPTMMSLYMAIIRASLIFDENKSIIKNIEDIGPLYEKINGLMKYGKQDQREFQTALIGQQMKRAKYLINGLIKYGPLNVFKNNDDIHSSWVYVSTIGTRRLGMATFSAYVKATAISNLESILSKKVLEQRAKNKQKWLDYDIKLSHSSKEEKEEVPNVLTTVSA